MLLELEWRLVGKGLLGCLEVCCDLNLDSNHEAQ